MIENLNNRERTHFMWRVAQRARGPARDVDGFGVRGDVT
jgi:hypothetical protein